MIQPSPREVLQPARQEAPTAVQPSADKPKPTFEAMYMAVFQQKERADAALQQTRQELAAAEGLVRQAREEFEPLPVAVPSSEPARQKLLEAQAKRDMVAEKLSQKYVQLQSLQMEFQPYQEVANAMDIATAATEQMQAIKAEAQKLQDENAIIQGEWQKVDGIEVMEQIRELQGQESHFLTQEKELKQELEALKHDPERFKYEPFRQFGENPAYAAQYAHIKASLDASDEAIAIKQSQIRIVQETLNDTRSQMKGIDDARLRLIARHNDCSNRYQALSAQYIAEEQRLQFAQGRYGSNAKAVEDSINQRARSATLN